MTAGKKVTQEKNGPVKSSNTWMSKWIPGTIAKKAVEAFKLIEKVMFSDNTNKEESDSNKVQILELQVKKLQQKVDSLLNTKPENVSPSKSVKKSVPSAADANTNKHQTASTSAKKMNVVSIPVAVTAQQKPQGKPRPFNAADLMNKKLNKTEVVVVKEVTEKVTSVQPSQVVRTVPVVPASRPFNAADLMNKKLKKAVTTEVPPSESMASTVSQHSQKKISPVKASRPHMKPFGSNDLKQIKLKNKSKIITNNTSNNTKTPAKLPVKAMSMQSALKNAIKSKFSKAQGTPAHKNSNNKNNNNNSSSDDDNDSNSISEW